VKDGLFIVRAVMVRDLSKNIRKGRAVKGSVKQIDRMLASRFELKYQISESKAAAVEEFVRPYIHLDHYCRQQPNGAYPIVSLYLDSPQFRLCRQTMEGNKNRFKLRVRSYTDDPDYPRFFEIKRRLNTIVIKSRARVMHPDIAALISGACLGHQNYKADEEMLRQFQFYMNSVGAQPVMRVRYIRRAYEGDYENRVRVTFDRQLAYNTSSRPEVTLEGAGWQRHQMNNVILEIKFTAHYPAWLNRMAKCFNLRQRSISKYVVSVRQSSLAGFCSPRFSV